MKYRASLNTTRSLERPVQMFCNSLEVAQDWAERVLAASLTLDTDTVTIYRLEEAPVQTIQRTKRDD